MHIPVQVPFIVTKFGNQTCHLRNQMRQIVEIKSVI